ncbi:disulfide bond formation protein DsbA [Candidatus Woesearchaeota archaeon CG10_big_fil_rev_8_21_14_0_10_36_11]|nr:MAG: disulfide bond formation protein DsbA [Candidatus Woesearchaeota archaeon CG10_big_fil_rev_8_21_14_0_10_36_11]
MTETYETHEHTKEPHKENASKGQSKVYKTLRQLVFVALVQVILLVIIAFQLNSLGGISADELVIPDVPDTQPTAPIVDMDTLIDDDAVLGSSNAPITIVEFSDYECPFCARFYAQTLQQIETQYVDTGKVKLIFRDFPLSFHQQAQKAAEAAECAGEQGKYYEMHNALFENGVEGGVTSFKKFALNLGLNTAMFNTCLDTGAMASEIQQDFLDGQRAGVQGTPAFFINGNLVSGAQPFSVFEQVIEAALQ